MLFRSALYAHKLQFISPDQFSILQSIDLLLMVVIGGLGSIHGVFLGSIFLITMPQLISLGKDLLPDAPGAAVHESYSYYGIDISIPYKLATNATFTVAAHYARNQNLSPAAGAVKDRTWFTAGVTIGF